MPDANERDERKRRAGAGADVDLKRLNRQLADMEAVRARYLPVWEEIAKYICPGRGVFSKQEPNQGERKDEALLDPTPLQSLHVLSAGLQGGLTSPSRPWFRLGVSDSGLADYGPVRLWLDEVERRMMHVLNQSNVYNCLHMLYQEVGAFGVGCMLMEEDPRNVIRGHTMTAGEYCLEYGVNGLPDRLGRSLWMTAYQMAAEFGEENLSDGARDSLKAGRVDRWFRVCHMVYREEQETRDGQRNAALPNVTELRQTMPYMSVYWEEGTHTGTGKLETPLRVGRYSEFPAMAPRWEVVGSDFYGRGPGWDALGEAKTLQEMRKDYLIAQKMMIAPPMVGPTSLRKSHRDLRPNGVTYVDNSDPNQFFRPLYQIQPDLPGQVGAMQDSREIIKRIFFADLFLAILQHPDKNMTATQVNAINQEQMMMIGPVYERLDHELLDPFIGRTFGIMDRFGLIPQPPVELEGKELKIEYISMLAQSQQMVGLGGIDRLAQFAGGIAPLNPEVLDKFDLDETVDQYARMLGVPAAIVRSDETVAAMREQRQRQEQAAAQMAAAQQMASAANQGAGALRQAAQASQMAQPDAVSQLGAMLGVPEEGAM